MKNRQLKTILLLSLISLPVLALAIGEPGTEQKLPSPVNSIQDILDILTKVTNWIFSFFLIIAVIFIIMAAFTYLGSAGDAEKVKTASNQLIYAAVGIAVALIAKAVVFVVANFIGA